MIAVLPPDCPDALLDEVRADLEARGWTCEASRGRAQTVLAVAGADSGEAVAAALAPRVVADVLPLRTGEQYARLRRKRRVLHGIAWGLHILIVLGVGIPVLAFLRSPVEVLLGPDVVRTGTVSEHETGTARVIRFDRDPVLLVHLGGERFFALRALCTHMDECRLEWSRDRQLVVCPCHGCSFDVYGNVVAGPSSIPLRSFEVQVLGEEVYVRRRG